MIYNTEELETIKLDCKSQSGIANLDYVCFYDDFSQFGIEIHDYDNYGNNFSAFQSDVQDAKVIIDWLTRFVNSKEN